jgi:lysophospholipase L1-like esterase
VRTQTRFPELTLRNFGVQGLMTRELVLDLEQAFEGRGDSVLAEALIKADFVILDLGRNDRWLFGEPAVAVRNLKRAQALIKSKVNALTGTSPLVITSVLMLPNRGSQGPWVKALNELIQRTNSKSAPADLRFDLVSKRLLASDQIHPTSKGYTALAQTLVSYLLKIYPKHVVGLRTDTDNDGLYDEFESSRFGTDPTNPDSDGDSILDGKDATPTGEQ